MDEEKLNTIEEAKMISEKLEKQNSELKLLLDRQEKILASQILGGRSQAGTPAPVVSKEDEARNRINEMLKSTGMHI